MPGLTCCGVNSPGGTGAIVTFWLPNRKVDIVLIVSPFFGCSKKTLRPPASERAVAGSSGTLHATPASVNAAMTTLLITRFLIATPFQDDATPRDYRPRSDAGQIRRLGRSGS